MNHPIQIEKIVIERNSRSRRSLPVQDFERVDEESKGLVVKVKRSKRPVRFTDYSKLTVERLKKAYAFARARGNQGKLQLISFELKRRGLYEKVRNSLKGMK